MTVFLRKKGVFLFKYRAIYHFFKLSLVGRLNVDWGQFFMLPDPEDHIRRVKWRKEVKDQAITSTNCIGIDSGVDSSGYKSYIKYCIT